MDPDRHLATPTNASCGSSTHSHSAKSRHRHSIDLSAPTIPTRASSPNTGPVKLRPHHSRESSTRLDPNARSDPDHRSPTPTRFARISTAPSTHFDPERTLDLDGAAPKRFVPTVAHED